MFFASRSKFSRCETKLRIWFSEIIRSRSLIKHHFVFPWRKIAVDCVLRDMMKDRLTSAVPKYPFLRVVTSTFLKNRNKGEVPYSEVE